jgi:hypothetical protein
MAIQSIQMPAPTWDFAVQIHMMVLQNPDASQEAVDGAKAEIRRLAQIVDKLNAEADVEEGQ